MTLQFALWEVFWGDNLFFSDGDTNGDIVVFVTYTMIHKTYSAVMLG